MLLVRQHILGAATTIIFALTGLLAGTSSAEASIIQYDLTQDTCTSGCGLSNYGKVVVSDLSGGGVHVVATLDPSADFVKTGALDYALVFSLTGGPNITIANLTTSDFSIGDSTGGSPNISAGGSLGSFEYGIACSACGSGGSNPKHGPIAFDITDNAITTASFTDGIKNSNHTGYYFVIDVMGPGGTGRVAAPAGHDITPSSNPPPVPEPATLALFGAALAGLGAMRRRRKH